MGIPRLTQDLQPYLEDVLLTANSVPTSLTIDGLVIDGPSLVYHVYNCLVSHYRTGGGTSGILDVPTYSVVNSATLHFLHDIEDQGVEIYNIFFDGALPEKKQPIRLERLERSRKALELYRAAYPTLTASQQQRPDFSQVLWHHRTWNRATEIVAPFIVPSVLDCLRSSKWASKVAVVPGEADSFCARAAAQSHAAVLTNDSDLVLFRALHDGIVVLLNSLTLDGSSTKPRLQARCWRPGKIAAQLSIFRLSHLGLARAKNPSVSFSLVVQKARDLAEEDVSLREFEMEYDTISLPALIMELNTFDPRLAELKCQTGACAGRGKLFMTLPFVLEDPNRDASWNYGKDIRRLAYSILVDYGTARISEVVEYTRKGQNIAASTIELLRGDYHEQFMKLQQQLRQYVRVSSSSTGCAWTILALHMVWRQRINTGKGLFTSHVLAILLGLAPLPVDRSSTADWDLIHLLGNVHAVLYGIRLLQQSFLAVSETYPELKQSLDQFPQLENVIWTLAQTREQFLLLPRKVLEAVLSPFTTEFDLKSILGLDCRVKTSIIDRAGKPSKDFVTVGPKRKRATKSKAEGTVPVKTHDSSRNAFEILSSCR